MFGIIRPCRHRLNDTMRTEWMAHLCGLCLALRGTQGQFSRLATNYDGLVISVLVDAQSRTTGDEDGRRRTAGPCPLRGMRTASVAQGEGARLAATVSLMLASAKVRDHVADGDGALGRRPVAAAARRVAGGWGRAGMRTGEGLGFDAAVLTEAVERQQEVESAVGVGSSLLDVTEPTETATAAAFAHTAVLAGRPQNAEPLGEAGRLFGRLAHLLDAVEDLADDEEAGSWNPVSVTRTPLPEVRRLCDDAVHGVRLALRDVEFVDGGLAHRLLAHELKHSVDRVFGTEHGSGGASCTHRGGGEQGVRDDRSEPGEQAERSDRGGRLTQPAQATPPDPRMSHGSSAPPPPPGQTPPGQSPWITRDPTGPPPPRPPGRRRSWLPGCAVWTGLCCTGQVCCSKEFDDPWSGKHRGGACRDGDCKDCCGDCCEECCCDSCCDNCDCCDCDCGC